jgi:hypothetical protein
LKLTYNISLVLPSIVPFSFGEEELNLDESVSALCSVTKGDLPLKINWSFKSDFENFSENLTTNDGILITRPSQKISTLGIESVKARHRGNYTCSVENRAGIASHSAYLAINGLKFFYEFCLRLCNLFPFTKVLKYLFPLKSSACNCSIYFRR